MTWTAALISSSLGPDFERRHRDPELSTSCAHPGAGRSPDPEALPAILPEAGKQPPRARPSPPVRPDPDLGRPLWLSSTESASSPPSLAGQGLLSELLQAPGRCRRSSPPPPPGRASKPDCTQGRADASRARAGSGPGRAWRRRRYRGPRDAPSRPLRRTPAPLPPAGLRASLLLATFGSPDRTPNCPSLPPGPHHPRSALQPWSRASSPGPPRS